MVRIDLELPDLEDFGCDFADGLGEGDFIEEPVGSAAFSDVLCASRPAFGLTLLWSGTRSCGRPLPQKDQPPRRRAIRGPWE